jgi:hypothetical protein
LHPLYAAIPRLEASNVMLKKLDLECMNTDALLAAAHMSQQLPFSLAYRECCNGVIQ